MDSPPDPKEKEGQAQTQMSLTSSKSKDEQIYSMLCAQVEKNEMLSDKNEELEGKIRKLIILLQKKDKELVKMSKKIEAEASVEIDKESDLLMKYVKCFTLTMAIEKVKMHQVSTSFSKIRLWEKEKVSRKARLSWRLGKVSEVVLGKSNSLKKWAVTNLAFWSFSQQLNQRLSEQMKRSLEKLVQQEKIKEDLSEKHEGFTLEERRKRALARLGSKKAGEMEQMAALRAVYTMKAFLTESHAKECIAKARVSSRKFLGMVLLNGKIAMVLQRTFSSGFQSIGFQASSHQAANLNYTMRNISKIMAGDSSTLRDTSTSFMTMKEDQKGDGADQSVLAGSNGLGYLKGGAKLFILIQGAFGKEKHFGIQKFKENSKEKESFEKLFPLVLSRRTGENQNKTPKEKETMEEILAKKNFMREIKKEKTKRHFFQKAQSKKFQRGSQTTLKVVESISQYFSGLNLAKETLQAQIQRIKSLETQLKASETKQNSNWLTENQREEEMVKMRSIIESLTLQREKDVESYKHELLELQKEHDAEVAKWKKAFENESQRANDRIKELVGIVSNLQNEKRECIHQLQEHFTVAESLTAEYKSLQQNYSRLQMANSHIRNQLESETTEKNKLQRDSEERKHALDHAKNRIYQLESAVSELEGKLEARESVPSAAARDHQERKAQIARITKELSSANLEIEASAEKMVKMKKTNAELTSEVMKMNNELGALRKENKSLLADKKNLEARLKEICMEQKRRNEDGKFKELYERELSEKSSLSQIVAGYQSKLSSMQSKLNTQMGSRDEELRSIQETNEELRSQIADMNREKVNVLRDMAKFQDRLSELSNENKEVKEKIERKGKEIDAKNREIEAKNKEIEENKRVLEMYQRIVCKLEQKGKMENSEGTVVKDSKILTNDLGFGEKRKGNGVRTAGSKGSPFFTTQFEAVQASPRKEGEINQNFDGNSMGNSLGREPAQNREGVEKFPGKNETPSKKKEMMRSERDAMQPIQQVKGAEMDVDDDMQLLSKIKSIRAKFDPK